jgi:glycine cleavage system aminomethyltransferase T
LRNRLVGFRLDANIGEGQIPEPPALVIHNGILGGRVTSCAYSPAAGCAVGLAWVPSELSHNGDRIEIHVDGHVVTAIVQDEPFFDPSGERLKS